MAVTSAGFPPDTVQLRLNSVRIDLIKSEKATLIGRVIDNTTSMPVTTAVIKTQNGNSSCHVNADGMYYLNVAPGKVELIAKADGYRQTQKPVVVTALRNRQMFTDIVMTKSRYQFGDIIQTIDVPCKIIRSIAAAGNNLYYTGGDSKSDIYLYRMSLKDKTSIRLLRISNMWGLAYCNISAEQAKNNDNVKKAYLLSIDWWPGRLYAIDIDKHRIKLLRNLNFDWPRDLAFDGKNVWLIERSVIDNQYGIRKIDFRTGKELSHIISADIEICGVAYGDKCLWVSSELGYVYKVNPGKAEKTGEFESGIIKTFKGNYTNLSFGNNCLWALNPKTSKICKLCLKETMQ